MVGWVGLEPTAVRLKVECSTTELPAHIALSQQTGPVMQPAKPRVLAYKRRGP